MEVKLVIWDLDKTLWDGTLAEKENLKIYYSRFELIKTLNKKGIMNSICSKNDFNETKTFMQKHELWDYFVFPKIEFLPKGEQVGAILNEMHLRAENTIFIDDNNANLKEVKYYNPNITVLNEENCDEFLNNIISDAKDDKKLKRFNQYKQLEAKTKIQKTYSSNEEFLKQSDIKIKFLNVSSDLFERLCELSERTNQLNFTKNRMSKEELENILKDENIETRLIHASDNYGDYGIIGFYSLCKNKLIHYVFSCRIMNMGIEQFVYQYLNYPEIEIKGEVASKLESKKIDYIKIIEENLEEIDSNESVDNILDEKSKIKIFGIGACDLYHPIAYFSMPNQEFLYECNVFIGDARGVNVGTEYLRSQIEMNEEEKKYIRKHFSNYKRFNVFDSKIFNYDWDYIIMSFHDDMIYKIYSKKDNSNLRIVFSPNKIFGVTNVLNVYGQENVSYEEQKKWLNENFEEGQYISQERFLDNLLWIKDHVSKKAKIILITGPEQNFFRKSLPRCPKAKKQIKLINEVIYKVGKEYKDKFIVVDINKVIRSKKDYTDYIFHLQAKAAYKLFINIIDKMIKVGRCNKPSMLSKVLNKRKVLIYGSKENEIKNAYFNLKLGNVNPYSITNDKIEASIFRSFIKNKLIGKYDMEINLFNWKKFKNKSDEYYVVVADNENYASIREKLINSNYTPIKDFIQLKPIEYKKIWQD